MKRWQKWLGSTAVLTTLLIPTVLMSPKAQTDAEAAYAELQKRYPHDEPVGKMMEIKLYNDPELMRQSVKLSLAWQFAGRYEYGEIIKWSSKPARADRKTQV